MSGDVLSADTSARHPQEHIGTLVAIRPGRTLVFNVDSPIKRMSRNITIRNISNFPVTYKIKTTSREGYRVKPHMGLLEVGQSADSVITLLPHNQYRVPQDKFLVIAVRAGNKLKAKDRRKLDNFWKKFSKEKFGADFMEHQLSCALNVDEYLANEEQDKFATTDSEADRRFQDESVTGSDYITPVSSVLLKQIPLRKSSKQNAEQLEWSSTDYIKSVTPPPSPPAALDYIKPSMQANAQESVTPEYEYSVAAATKAGMSDDEFFMSDASEILLKKEAAFCDNSTQDADGKEKRVKRIFKSIMKKKRKSSSKEQPYSKDELGSVSRKSSKKVKVIEPKMFQKIRTCSDDDGHVSADEVVISLMRTEDVLNRHITCFKGFQVFVVVAICALCVIIIILMVNFPISIHKANSSS